MSFTEEDVICTRKHSQKVKSSEKITSVTSAPRIHVRRDNRIWDVRDMVGGKIMTIKFDDDILAMIKPAPAARPFPAEVNN